MLLEYYKRPDATAESINAEGYFMTGDAGFLDEEGHLKIIDRVPRMSANSINGAMFAPNYIENKLEILPVHQEVVCFGHDRDMVCAFVNIDISAVGNWAETAVALLILAMLIWRVRRGLQFDSRRVC